MSDTAPSVLRAFPRGGRPWRLLRDALLIVVIFLVLSEIVLRLVVPDALDRQIYNLNLTQPSASFVRWDDRYVHRHPSNGEFRHVTRDYDVTYRTDDKGFRLVRHSRERERRPRLLLLGDSFLFGTGVSDAEALAQRLEDEGKFDVVGAGQVGWGTANELLLLDEIGVAAAPDVVLLLFCTNDYGDNVNGYYPTVEAEDGRLIPKLPEQARAIYNLIQREYRSGRGFYSLVPELSTRRIAEGYLMRYSRTYLALATLAPRLKHALRPILGRPLPPLDGAPEAEVTARYLELMKERAGRLRSEERRVGKECRSRWSPYH